MEIHGTCDDPNFTTTPVVADILDAPDLHGTDDGIGGYLLKSFGKVKDDAPYGTWPVHFMCGTTKVETTFTVVTRGRAVHRGHERYRPHPGREGHGHRPLRRPGVRQLDDHLTRADRR